MNIDAIRSLMCSFDNPQKLTFHSIITILWSFSLRKRIPSLFCSELSLIQEGLTTPHVRHFKDEYASQFDEFPKTLSSIPLQVPRAKGEMSEFFDWLERDLAVLSNSRWFIWPHPAITVRSLFDGTARQKFGKLMVRCKLTRELEIHQEYCENHVLTMPWRKLHASWASKSLETNLLRKPTR